MYYQICVNGRKDLPYAADEQAAFDMTLIRLFAFKPMQSSDTTSEEKMASTPLANNGVDFNDVEFNDTESIANDVNELTTTVQSQKSIDEPIVTVPEDAQTIEDPQGETSEQEALLAQEMQQIEQQAAQLYEPMASVENNTTSSSEPQPVKEQTSESLESSSEQVAKDDTLFDSPVSAVLAGRNMLRSRKKQLEQQAKKSSDVAGRQAITQATQNDLAKSEHEHEDEASKKVELPAPEQPYQAEKIDPATIKKANQVDQWAHMIDSMELTARLRQLAIHATIDESSTEQHLILSLDQATRHLYTDVAQQQLQQTIRQYLSQNVTVTINLVEETVADPYQIQTHINDKRYDYAKELLKNDDIVLALQQHFQATLDEQSISAI